MLLVRCLCTVFIHGIKRRQVEVSEIVEIEELGICEQ